MQGDPKVNELMRPVLVAIERHVKDREAATEIYNRAYEAVMNSMDVKTGKTYCAYCGAEYPLDDAAAQVSEHIKTCEKHPMRAVEAELRKWQTGEIVGIEFVPKMFNELELKNARANARAEAAEASAEKLQAALEEEGRRNAVFTACLHKAQNLYLEAHPDYPGWPDGAVNITWVLEAFDKERAEVKRLQDALAAANEDAARLASSLENDAYPFPIRRSIDEKDAALRAHRARVGGAS